MLRKLYRTAVQSPAYPRRHMFNLLRHRRAWPAVSPPNGPHVQIPLLLGDQRQRGGQSRPSTDRSAATAGGEDCPKATDASGGRRQVPQPPAVASTDPSTAGDRSSTTA